jgi:hypothetical protein
MTQAQKIVSRLLEDHNPYDIDDPLEKPQYHGGFIAKSPEGERFEVRLVTRDDGKQVYHWQKFWWNDLHQRLDPFDMGRAQVKPEESEAYIQREAAKYGNNGWQIEFL